MYVWLLLIGAPPPSHPEPTPRPVFATASTLLGEGAWVAGAQGYRAALELGADPRAELASVATLASVALKHGDSVWIPETLSRFYTPELRWLRPEELRRLNLLVGAAALLKGHYGEAEEFLGSIHDSPLEQSATTLRAITAIVSQSSDQQRAALAALERSARTTEAGLSEEDYLRARLLLELGRLEESAALLSRADGTRMDDDDPALDRAWIALRLGRLEDARAWADLILAAGPGASSSGAHAVTIAASALLRDPAGLAARTARYRREAAELSAGIARRRSGAPVGDASGPAIGGVNPPTGAIAPLNASALVTLRLQRDRPRAALLHLLETARGERHLSLSGATLVVAQAALDASEPELKRLLELRTEQLLSAFERDLQSAERIVDATTQRDRATLKALIHAGAVPADRFLSRVSVTSDVLAEPASLRPLIPDKRRPRWTLGEAEVFEDPQAKVLIARGAAHATNDVMAISLASGRAAGALGRTLAIAAGSDPCCYTVERYQIVDHWYEQGAGTTYALAILHLEDLSPEQRSAVKRLKLPPASTLQLTEAAP